MKTILTSITALFVICHSSFVIAQGSLTPPGAPAPTMKTLDQVEPRTPISSLPFTISTPGVYYLTKSITTNVDGIIINADDVVLDLGGFTLTGDGGTGDVGVDVSGQARVIIRNGSVPSFGTGVRLGAAAGGSPEALIEDLILVGNAGFGLFGESNTFPSILVRSVIRRVRAIGNASGGILLSSFAGAPNGQNLIDQCEVINNTGIGLQVGSSGNLIVRCLASGNATNWSISANNRFGIIVVPAQNAGNVSGNSGGAGTGTTDPFANLTY